MISAETTTTERWSMPPSSPIRDFLGEHLETMLWRPSADRKYCFDLLAWHPVAHEVCHRIEKNLCRLFHGKWIVEFFRPPVMRCKAVRICTTHHPFSHFFRITHRDG